MELQAALWGVLVPGLFAGIGMLLLCSRFKRGAGSSLVALLATLSFASGYIGLFGWPPLPSGTRMLAATDWFVWFVLAAGLSQILERKLGTAAVIGRWLLATAMLLLIMRATIEYQWEGAQVALGLTTITMVGFSIWLSVRALKHRVGTGPSLALLFIAFTALALCAALTGSSKIGQMTGLFCSILAAFTIVGWLRPLPPLCDADVTLFVLALTGLGLCASFYSELPLLDAALIAAGLLIPWLAELPYFQSWSKRQRGALRIILTIVCVGIAVTRSILSFEPDPYGY